MSTETHIGSKIRKELCGRLFYFNNIQPYKESLSQHGSGRILDTLRDSLFVFITDELKSLGINHPTDSFIEKVSLHFLRTAEPALEKHPEILRSVKRSLKKRCNEITCSNCSSSQSLSSEVVGGLGCCIATLRQYFEVAHETARIYYAKFLSSPSVELPEVVFSTKHSRDFNDLHDLPVDFAINGATQYCSLDENVWSNVILKMCIEKFDFNTYLAVPYVLFHECIAHAFHGLMPTVKGRKASDPEDEFAEGWMDFVAFKILEEVIRGKGPAKHVRSKVKFPDQTHPKCYELYFSRVDLEGKPDRKPSENAIHRKYGQNAADKIFNVLQDLPASRRHHWKVFLEMSFEMNIRQSFDPIQRRQFIALINNLVSPGETKTPRHYDVERVISKYLKHKDITKFIEDILGLRARWIKRGARPLNPKSPSLTVNIRPPRFH